ncbi:MAG TPA: hypothetical protein VGK33_10795 [Chloroflexota bacterium]|jgi:hypothetical protein
MNVLIVIGGVYALSSLVSSVLFGVLANRSDADVPGYSPDASLDQDMARLRLLGHTPEEIARLVACRVAVRAGYVSDELKDSETGTPR